MEPTLTLVNCVDSFTTLLDERWHKPPTTKPTASISSKTVNTPMLDLPVPKVNMLGKREASSSHVASYLPFGVLTLPDGQQPAYYHTICQLQQQ
jgi:hypothetical protein